MFHISHLLFCQVLRRYSSTSFPFELKQCYTLWIDISFQHFICKLKPSHYWSTARSHFQRYHRQSFSWRNRWSMERIIFVNVREGIPEKDPLFRALPKLPLRPPPFLTANWATCFTFKKFQNQFEQGALPPTSTQFRQLLQKVSNQFWQGGFLVHTTWENCTFRKK